MKFKLKQIFSEMHEILDKAEAEGRKLTPMEEKRYAELDRESDELAGKIKQFNQALNAPIKPDVHLGDNNYRNFNNQGINTMKRKNEYTFNPDGKSDRDIFNKYLQRDLVGLSSDERRGLFVGDDTAGGYLAPVALADFWLKELDDYIYIRQYAKKITLDRAISLRIPHRKAKMSSPIWTSELLTGDADTQLGVDAFDFFPAPLAKRILVSKTLLRLARVSPEDIVMAEFKREFGEVLENEYMTGEGVSGRPIGIFTPSDAGGASTDRDIVSSVSASFTADDIYRLIAHVRAPYRKGLKFIMNRDTQLKILRLKSGDGVFLYQPSLQAGIPDRLCGYDVLLSEFAPPDSYASGSYCMAVANLEIGYLVVDSLALDVQRLVELYAATNQIGMIARMETTAGVIDEQAIARLKLK